MAALRWSSDFTVAEYRDIPAKIITLDCTGRYLLLPSRRQLAIKDLTEPIEDVLLFPRNGKAEVIDASWNPHYYNKQLFALCTGTSVEILSWYNECELKNIKILRAHTRVTTGVDWHPIDPNIVASSSLDAYTHVWDVRDIKKPVLSFSSFAGATHVKWNKLSRHVLATTHSGDIKIWDERRNTSPVQYITAYSSNVFCVDWSPTKQNHIAAANQDGNIKLYNIREPQKTRAVIDAGAPVWKVSYTPFGCGNTVLGVMIPETRKSESSLLLWHLSKCNVPLHTFVGHAEIVLDIEWRISKEDDSEYQLITWDKDQTLRIWEVDKHLIQLSGQDTITLDASNTPIIQPEVTTTSITTPITSPSDDVIAEDKDYAIVNNFNGFSRESRGIIVSSTIPIHSNQDLTHNSRRGITTQGRKSSISSASIDDDDHLAIKSVDLTPTNLSQEFALNFNIPSVQFDKVDPTRRLCSVTIKQETNTIVLLINFPPSYPRNKSPVFRFMQGTTIDNTVKNNLLKLLKETAEQKVRNNEVCLEACLTELVTTIEKAENDDKEKSEADKSSGDSDNNKENSNNNSNNNNSASNGKEEAYVLMPRTCGAKFCHIGTLVCFMKPKPILIEKNGLGGLTLKRYLQNANSGGTLSARRRYVISRGLLRKIKVSSRIHTRLIVIYDVSSIFLVNKNLAEKYAFVGSDMSAVCKKNAQIAETVGRKDLASTWNLAALAAASPPTEPTEYVVDWDKHPFAREMVESMINYYSSVHDIQTAAMLACIFCHRKWATNEVESKNLKTITAALRSSMSNRKWWYKPNNFPYHTVHPVESSESCWNYTDKRHRSNSWSEYSDDMSFENPIEQADIVVDTKPTPLILQQRAVRQNDFYETIKILYAELLNKWQLLIPRTLVMKCVNITTETHRGVELVVECGQCQNSVTTKVCPHCKIPSLICIICRLSVKGSANFCLACGHGGHTEHMQNWFKTERTCPAGCKCECLLETDLFFYTGSSNLQNQFIV